MQVTKDDFKRFQDKVNAPDKNVSQEFQIYGCELAEKLEDLKHKALYIKLAKNEPRDLLERAASFALDYPNAQSKGKLFMFKLKQLKTLNS